MTHTLNLTTLDCIFFFLRREYTTSPILRQYNLEALCQHLRKNKGIQAQQQSHAHCQQHVQISQQRLCEFFMPRCRQWEAVSRGWCRHLYTMNETQQFIARGHTKPSDNWAINKDSFTLWIQLFRCNEYWLNQFHFIMINKTNSMLDD